MKVFVTGATGFVGREILRQLLAAGHEVRILARQLVASSVREISPQPKIEAHYGNALDAHSLKGSLDGILVPTVNIIYDAEWPYLDGYPAITHSPTILELHDNGGKSVTALNR